MTQLWIDDTGFTHTQAQRSIPVDGRRQIRIRALLQDTVGNADALVHEVSARAPTQPIGNLVWPCADVFNHAVPCAR